MRQGKATIIILIVVLVAGLMSASAGDLLAQNAQDGCVASCTYSSDQYCKALCLSNMGPGTAPLDHNEWDNLNNAINQDKEANERAEKYWGTIENKQLKIEKLP